MARLWVYIEGIVTPDEETIPLFQYMLKKPNDLVKRFKYNLLLSESNRETYYTGGEKGYTDYRNAIL